MRVTHRDITVLKKKKGFMFSSDGQRPFFSSSQERRFRGYVLSLSLSFSSTPLYFTCFFTPPKCPERKKKMFVCMINVCLYDFGGRWYKKTREEGGWGDMFLFRPDWGVAGGRRQPLPMHFYAGFFVSESL